MDNTEDRWWHKFINNANFFRASLDFYLKKDCTERSFLLMAAEKARTIIKMGKDQDGFFEASENLLLNSNPAKKEIERMIAESGKIIVLIEAQYLKKL